MAIFWLSPKQPQHHSSCNPLSNHIVEEPRNTSSNAQNKFQMPLFVEDVHSRSPPIDWGSLQMGLRTALNVSMLKLLPHDGHRFGDGSKLHRWLAVGMSSVHRDSAEYLTLTLAHLFAATSVSDLNGVVVVVHLADADEQWVAQTAEHLQQTFARYLHMGCLHVIHAPALLYPFADGWGKPKFGDSADRQRWRSKQNLDYMYLMLYAATLAENYLQLEDDVQVVPNFVIKVRDYVNTLTIRRQPWTMIAFSHMGFIGKMFPSTQLMRLAEFMGAFFDQAPCDWLFWNFLDILSLEPITPQIPDDLEREEEERHRPGKHPLPRNDVILLYLGTDRSLLGPPETAIANTEPPLAVDMPMPAPVEYTQHQAIKTTTTSSGFKKVFLPRAPNVSSVMVVEHSKGESQMQKAAFVHVSALLAIFLGMLAGIVAWVIVLLGWRICRQGMIIVGESPCWVIPFLLVSNVFLCLQLKSHFQGNSQSSCLPDVNRSVQHHHNDLSIRISPLFASRQKEASPSVRALPSWRSLQFGLRKLSFWSLQLIPHIGKDVVVDPIRRWLTIGIQVSTFGFDRFISQTLPQLMNSMGANDRALCTVVLGLDSLDQAWLEAAQKKIFSLFSSEINHDILKVVSVKPHFHPTDKELASHPSRLNDTPFKRRVRSDANVRCAFLLWFASFHGDYYMELDENAAAGLEQGFVGKLQHLVETQRSTTWNMISFSKFGLNRKLLRGGENLRRLAELVFMFHDATLKDGMIWDFLDIFQNLAPPKAARLQLDAGERIDKGLRQRSDIALQHHEAQKSMIEHLGDVSSLRGKVQAIRDPYFKEHRLEDSLFDCPPVSVHTNILDRDAVKRLEALYDKNSYLQGLSFQIDDFMKDPSHSRPGYWFVEFVLQVPVVIEYFLMHMGASANSKVKSALYHVLVGADLEVAREAPGGSCSSYHKVARINGREAFVYVGPVPSEPTESVDDSPQAKCLRLVLRSPQKTPVVITGVRISTLHMQPSRTIISSSTTKPLVSGKSQDVAWKQEAQVVDFHMTLFAVFLGGLIVRLVGEMVRTSRGQGRRKVGVAKVR